MDASKRERILKHLHHCAVPFARLRLEKGAVVAHVKEEFDLADPVRRMEALGEDLVTAAGRLGVRGWQLCF